MLLEEREKFLFKRSLPMMLFLVVDIVGHAFLADYRPSYREGPAFALWPKIVAFFEQNLR